MATKSSGAILAPLLFAFLLALAGCGGGGGADASSTQSTSAAPKEASADPSASSQQDGKQGQGKEQRQKAPQPSSSSSSSSSSPAAKHGPHIAQPKGKREHAPSQAEVEHSAVADISLESPNFITTASSEYELPATYTCEGKDAPPTLRWSGVPAGSAELILFVLGLEPVGDTLFFNWAVAGLSPSLTEIPTGRLPTGAILGRNSYGKEAYRLCPAKGQAETYVFALYALPHSLSPKKGFDPMSLRKEALAKARDVGLVTAGVGG